jgi:hypothetical protein
MVLLLRPAAICSEEIARKVHVGVLQRAAGAGLVQAARAGELPEGVSLYPL